MTETYGIETLDGSTSRSVNAEARAIARECARMGGRPERVSPYARKRVAGKCVYLHRAVYEAHYGPLPEVPAIVAVEIHHNDHDKANNSLANLRAMPHVCHSALHLFF